MVTILIFVFRILLSLAQRFLLWKPFGNNAKKPAGSQQSEMMMIDLKQ